MLQRFQLLVWPDLVRPTGIIDRTPDEAALEAYHNAMLNLPSTVSGMAGRVKHGAHGQPLMHFDSDAQKLFISWYETLEAMLTRSNLDSARQSHYAKYRSLIPALALIFHLLDGQCGSVGVGNLAKAIRFAIYLKGHAARIYASVSGADHTSTNALARKILKGGLRDGFTCRTVYTKGWSGISTKASAQGALDVLVEYGWLLEQEKRSGGRPTVAYRVNAGVSAALLCD
jgi:hypothetical protein